MEFVNGESRPIASLDAVLPAPATVRMGIVDGDSGFTQVLARRVRAVGWRAEVPARTPSVEQLAGMRLHVVLMDIARFVPDGWSYLERLCACSPSQVVIVCTGASSVAQRVRGLRLGADDWITKPCHPEEVLARVEAALRRTQSAASIAHAREPVIAGELEIRPEMFEAFVGGRPVGLTRREFELLALLASASGTVIPRERIYERVWGYAMVHGDRSVDVFVRKLRRKLEVASPSWRYLHTHFGVGYRFDPEEADRAKDDLAEPPG